MKIRFCGADRCVTGSCHMVEYEGGKLLIDCGMRQGSDKNTELGEANFPFSPGEINAVLLTHAHIDHSGLLPLLVKRGFKGKIVTTRATAELSGIMLPDSGHIQEQEAEYTNRKNLRAGKPEVKPLYDVNDATAALKAFEAVSYGDVAEIAPNVRARFTDVGHLLGSAAIELWVDENGKTTKTVFSGDVGRDNRPILNDPQPLEGGDYVLLEGTYGDREHEASTDKEKEAELENVLREGIARGGNIVIPSFAVGRTQEILYYIKRMLMRGTLPGLERVPVYIDSPLGISATKVYERCAEEYYDDEAKEMAKSGSPFDFPTLRIAQNSDESKLINSQEGCNIIISSSGMCDAGRIRHHLKHNLYRKDSTIVFAGYQAEGTLGRMLIDGTDKVKLFGEEISVNAAIRQIEGFSGHASESELIEWLSGLGRKPRCVFLVHGEEATLESFSRDLEARGYSVEIPSLLDEYDLAPAAAVEKLPATSKPREHNRDIFSGKTIDTIARLWRLSGAVAVTKNGSPVFSGAFGQCDHEKGALNTLHTTFASGAMTTMFTSALMLKLDESGMLSLNDKLDKYVPEYVHASKLTLGDLLGDEVRPADYIEAKVAGKCAAESRKCAFSVETQQKHEWNAFTKKYSDGDVIAMINDEPLMELDTDETGISSAYRLLGMALERASGRTIGELMQKELFEPLGMKETSFAGEPDAKYYAGEASKRIPLSSPEGAGGEAGVTISANDMMIWLGALLSGKFLGRDARRLMLTKGSGLGRYGFYERAGWYYCNTNLPYCNGCVYIAPHHGICAAIFANMPESLESGAECDDTGAYSLQQRLRREMDAAFLVCCKPKLVPINGDNFVDAIHLKPAANQTNFVAPNDYSLSEAFTQKSVAKPYIISEDGIAVGFVMLYVDKKAGKFEIWRFMIDERFQGKGFGKAGMLLAIDKCRKLGAKLVTLSVALSNETAKRLYSELGFVYTGRVEDGEEYMELEIPANG